MSKKTLFQLKVSNKNVADAIKAGYVTSSEIAGHVGAHQVTVQKKLKEMFANGLLKRRKIGTTYMYTVPEGIIIPDEYSPEERERRAKLERN